MKNYIFKTNYEHPLDAVNDAFESLIKPIFYDEKLDSMKTDIKETDNGYELEVEMPGFDKADINISLENEYLTISAEKKQDSEEESKKRYLRKERSISCSRSYYVGDVKETDIKASYDNGVLRVILPKAQPEAPQKHSISIE